MDVDLFLVIRAGALIKGDFSELLTTGLVAGFWCAVERVPELWLMESGLEPLAIRLYEEPTLPFLPWACCLLLAIARENGLCKVAAMGAESGIW